MCLFSHADTIQILQAGARTETTRYFDYDCDCGCDYGCEYGCEYWRDPSLLRRQTWLSGEDVRKFSQFRFQNGEVPPRSPDEEPGGVSD